MRLLGFQVRCVADAGDMKHETRREAVVMYTTNGGWVWGFTAGTPRCVSNDLEQFWNAATDVAHLVLPLAHMKNMFGTGIWDALRCSARRLMG